MAGGARINVASQIKPGLLAGLFGGRGVFSDLVPGINDAYGAKVAITPPTGGALLPLQLTAAGDDGTDIALGETVTVRITVTYRDGSTQTYTALVIDATHPYTNISDLLRRAIVDDSAAANAWKLGLVDAYSIHNGTAGEPITKIEFDAKTDQAVTTVVPFFRGVVVDLI